MALLNDRGDVKAMEEMSRVQKKTFTRWANHFLSERMLKIEDLYIDLKDGIKFINLLEMISAKNLGKYDKKPKHEMQEIGNLNIGLRFIKDEGLKLVGIGAEDIHKGNGKLILGTMWTLILRYQIQTGEGNSPKQELLDWINKQTEPYRDHIPKAENFTTSFQDGKILSALTDSLKPGLINTKALSEPIPDTNKAIEEAFKNFQIPQLVDAQDMCLAPDEHSNMTYLDFFRDYVNNRSKVGEEYLKHGPSPTHCFAVGRGVQGGFARRPLPFTIHSRTVNDLPVTGKWIRPYAVTITGPDGADIPASDLKDNKDGTFFCRYTAPVAGEIKVRIEVMPEVIDGQPRSDIKGSTYVLVAKEPCSASHTFCDGPGVVGAVDDTPAVFTVHCRDQFNNAVVGDPIAITVDQIECSDPTKRALTTVPVDVKDNQDGTHTVTYNPTVAGVYRVNVTVANESVKDMPKNITCLKAADPAHTTASGVGVTSGAPRVGIPAPFKVQVKDARGNPVVAGGHDLKVALKQPNGDLLPVELKDNKDGTYDGAYTPHASGDHVVSVQLNGKEIKDAPFKVNIKNPSDPSKSYAEGPGLVQAWDNQPSVFKVFAKDEDGRPVSGEPVVVTAVGPDGTQAPVEVKDNGDGVYNVVYDATKPGVYTVDASIRGQSIKDMPKKVVCHPAPDGSKSTVHGPGVDGGFAGRPLPFTVKTFDRNGQPVTVGNANITAQVVDLQSGKPVPVEVKDNGDGTYSGNYQAPHPGKYQVAILLDGKAHVGKSPYTVTAKPPAAPLQSFAKGRGWNEAWDALPTMFTIYAKDEKGQPVAGEVVRCVMRRVTTPAEQAKIDGEMAQLDDYLRAKKGHEVKRLEAERLAKQEEAAAKQEADIKTKVWTDPEGDVAVELKDRGDGTYMANYTAAVPGTYEISVTVGEDAQHIKESPHTLPVHISKPKLVFWSHTYSKEKEELAAAKKKLEEYEELLRKNNLLQ